MIKILEKLKSTFMNTETPKEDSFDTQTGTQKFALQTFPYLFDDAPQFTNLYKEMHNNITLLDNAIEVYVQLINSGYTIETETEEDVPVINNVLDNIRFHTELNELIQNTFIYGYSGSEIVLSRDFNDVLRLVNVPSEDLRVFRDKQANITSYFQVNTGNKFIELNRNRFLYFAIQGTTSEPYGRSIFRSLPFLAKIMVEMQDSIGKIYKKYGSPRFHVNYKPAIQLDDPTLTKRLNSIKEKFNNPKVGQDFFTAGEVEITVIGTEGDALKFNVEMEEIMQGVFAGLKLPAGVLGYNYGSTETHLAKQLEILLNRIISYQKYFATETNKKFMPLLAKVYGLSSIPKMRFNRPIIADEKAEVAVVTSNIGNMKNLLDMGIITQEYAIDKLELPHMTKVQLTKIKEEKMLAAQAAVKNESKGEPKK